MGAQSGWFPDPGGQPGMYRRWTGSAWTDQISSEPGGPGRGPGGRVRILVIVGSLLVLVLIAGWALLRPTDAGPSPAPPTVAPTASAWDERLPTPTGPPCPSYNIAVVNGRLYGGRLSVQVIDDPRWGPSPVRPVPWAACATSLQRPIAGSWVSEVVLTGILPDAHKNSLHEQAEAIGRDAAKRFYESDKGRFTIRDSRAVTVDGLSAWELRCEVQITYSPDISGDSVDVVVVQHDDGSRSALLTFATIGDAETQRQVDASRNSVRVEGR